VYTLPQERQGNLARWDRVDDEDTNDVAIDVVVEVAVNGGVGREALSSGCG
jgi:hypothetical protein